MRVKLDISGMDTINAAFMPSRLAINSGVRAFAALCVFVVMASAADAAELVMFRRDGCPWCAKWDREIGPIYPKTEFGKRAPLRMINLDRHADAAIVHRPIIYTPTFVLAENGKEIGRIEGYPGNDFFFARLEVLLAQAPQPAPKDMSQDVPVPGASRVTSEPAR
jgi:hypothetical protein